MRPFLKFDGIYSCKMMYRRHGLSETSMNHPVHEVISYKYIRFYPNGDTYSLYTVLNPKRFLPKAKEIFSLGEEEGGKIEEIMKGHSFDLNSGTFKIYNDILTQTQFINGTEYIYTFQMRRKS